MKIRALFFILTLSFFQTQITAQELVREGTQWNIYAVYWSFPPSAETISVKIEGDTLINDVSYKILHESYDSLNTSWLETNEYIREDSTKKVYLLTEDLGEIILYDFNLTVGDTFPIMGSDSWAGCDYMTVIQVDTIGLFNGEMRKKWTLESNAVNGIFGYTVHWYEGIGSSGGLTRYITEQYGCWEHYPYNLLCYYNDNGEQIFNESGACWLVPVKELNTADGISVYPNPTKDNIRIESKQVDRNIEKVQLYSAAGQLLSTTNINSITGKLSLSGYQNGAYYLLIEDSIGILRSVKLIKLE